MERPSGVTVLALFEFFIAIFLVLFALASALGANALGVFLARTREMGTPGAAIFAGAGMMLALILLIPALLFCVLGFGLWNLRNWARIATIVLAVLGAIGASMGLLLAVTHFRMFGVMASSMRLGIDLLVLWYLSQPYVARSFQPAG